MCYDFYNTLESEKKEKISVVAERKKRFRKMKWVNAKEKTFEM